MVVFTPIKTNKVQVTAEKTDQIFEEFDSHLTITFNSITSTADSNGQVSILLKWVVPSSRAKTCHLKLNVIYCTAIHLHSALLGRDANCNIYNKLTALKI